MKKVLFALLIVVLPAVTLAAPLVRLKAVYSAGKAIQANGLDAERLANFKTAIAEAEDAVVTKKERDALALYKQALDIYRKVLAEVEAQKAAHDLELGAAKAILDDQTPRSADARRLQHDLAELGLKRAQEIREAPMEHSFEEGRKLNVDADRAYLNKPKQ